MTIPELPKLETVSNMVHLPRAFSNVQPFTYEDGLTHYQVLERLRAYVQNYLVPAINEALTGFGDEIEELVNGVLNDVIARLDAQTEYVDGEIADLIAYVDNAVQSIINSSIELQDTVMAGIVNDEATDTREALDATYANKATQTTVETGRLSSASLNAAFANKATQTTVESGRLSVTSERNKYGYRFSILDYGGESGSGVPAAQNISAYNSAKNAAGPNGSVYFPIVNGAEETVYNLDGGTRLDLSGTNIVSDPGVIINVRPTPNLKDWNLGTDVVIRSGETSFTRPVPRAHRIESPDAYAANVETDNANVQAMVWTSWEAEGFGGGFAPYTSVPNGMVRSGFEVSWPNGFGGSAGYEGPMAIVQVGHYYEALSRMGRGSSSSYAGPMVISDDNYLFGIRNYAGTQAWSEFGSDEFAPTIAAPRMFNGLYAHHSVNGVSIGIRVTNDPQGRPRVVEFFANGRVICKKTMLKDVRRIAFVKTSSDANLYRLLYPVTYGPDYRPKSAHYCGRVSFIGDSNTYGAFSSVTFPELINTALSGLPNGGMIDVGANHGISGSGAEEWASSGSININNYDFTTDDYTVVFLGTNDAREPQQYLEWLTSIRNKIVADGSTPIFVVFPFWFNSVFTGGGIATASPSEASTLRAALTYWAASSANRFQLAFALHEIGDAYPLINDNIHWRENGMAVIARTVANAIARAELQKVSN